MSGVSIPENYDNYLGPLLFEPYAIDLIERIQNGNYQSILETACGTGRVTQYLGNIFTHDEKIVASDINPDMLEIARKKVNVENIEWKIMDMQDIIFDDSSFDLVFSQFGIMFVPDKPKAFSEFYRVLKPGGKLLFNTWNKLEENPAPKYTHEVINSFFEDDPILFYKVPFSYFDQKEIYNDLNDAGFKNITIEVLKKNMTTDNLKDAVKGFIEGNPAIAGINERDPSLVNIIKDKLEKIFAEKLGNNPVRFPLNALIIEANK